MVRKPIAMGILYIWQFKTCLPLGVPSGILLSDQALVRCDFDFTRTNITLDSYLRSPSGTDTGKGPPDQP